MRSYHYQQSKLNLALMIFLPISFFALYWLTQTAPRAQTWRASFFVLGIFAFLSAGSFAFMSLIAKRLDSAKKILRLVRGVFVGFGGWEIQPQPEPPKDQKKDTQPNQKPPVLNNAKEEEKPQEELKAEAEELAETAARQAKLQARRERKKAIEAKVKERTEQEVQPLKEKYQQLKFKLDQAAHDPTGGKVQIAGVTLNVDKYAKDKQDLADVERQLAVIKEGNIKAIRHTTPRAFKELPHFFKFPLVKAHPKRPIERTIDGQVYIPKLTEVVDFQRVKAEITYFGGELGDQDRMVWLAVMNQAIRNKEFVKEFGWIPYSREDIANEAGISSNDRKARVSESLRRLQHTFIDFKSPFGDFAFKGAFHLLDSVVSVESKKVKADIHDKLQPIIPGTTGEGEPPNPIITPEFAAQAKVMLERIKPKAPKINLIRFHANLMDAILGNQITTIDLWAIKDFTPTEKTLFLYLYDISQWRTSADPLAMTIKELMTLLDLKPQIVTSKGKEYVEWNRSKKQIEAAMVTVETTLKHIIDHSWNGKGEESVLLIQFAKNVKQLPNQPE